MHGGQTPLVSITLRDGSLLRISPGEIALGDARYAMSAIQDARQVAPDPETVALRIANKGLVEFRPAVPGEGALALEAIFRSRPELRPPGFEPPANTPRWWPPAGGVSIAIYRTEGFAAPATSPYEAPPSRFAAAPLYSSQARYAAPSAPGRAISEVLGGAIRRYLGAWRTWVALGLLLGLLPEALSGMSQLAIYLALGLNPWGAIPDIVRVSPTGEIALVAFAPPSAASLILYGGVILACAVGNWILGAWFTAAVANGARDQTRTGALAVGASVRRGSRRLFPVLLVSLVVTLLVWALPLVGYAALLASAAWLAASGVGPSSSPAATASALPALLLGIVGLVLIPTGLIFGIFLKVRLLLAPVVSATGQPGTRGALVSSWRLTRGRWWRTFTPWVLILLLTYVVVLPFTLFQNAYFALTTLLIVPLATACVAPLIVLVKMTVLDDLRMRAGQNNVGEDTQDTTHDGSQNTSNLHNQSAMRVPEVRPPTTTDLP